MLASEFLLYPARPERPSAAVAPSGPSPRPKAPDPDGGPPQEPAAPVSSGAGPGLGPEAPTPGASSRDMKLKPLTELFTPSMAAALGVARARVWQITS